MRENDRKSGRTGDMVRPRFMVWENVPGAFSSNGGKDFQAVLTEIARVAEPDAPDVPLPEKGKWSKAGCLYGAMGEWSIAWRVHDAQFWGVPQRRKRIALVADFGGLSAPEILFERKGLSGDFEPCGEAGQETAGAAGGGVTGAGVGVTAFNQLSQSAVYKEDDVSVSLTVCGGSYGGGSEVLVASAEAQEHGHQPLVVSNEGDIAGTLDASYYKGTGARNGKERTVVCVGNGQLNQMSMAEQANTLDTMHDQQAVMVAAVDCRNGTENPNINGTLQAKSTGGTGTNFNNVLRANAIVRRLTPLECERLQGYPDGWTDIGEWTDSKGKKHKDADSPRYKALGNSIALPFWQWMFGRIVEQYPAERRDKLTLGSLFDGIGGFPLTAQRNGIEPVWASEIEEFPIAVTKARFPDESV